jgi:hypothetical protein
VAVAIGALLTLGLSIRHSGLPFGLPIAALIVVGAWRAGASVLQVFESAAGELPMKLAIVYLVRRCSARRRCTCSSSRCSCGASMLPPCASTRLFMQLPSPRRSHGFDHQLKLASGLVQGYPPLYFHQITLSRQKIQEFGRATKHGAAHLPLVVFQ